MAHQSVSSWRVRYDRSRLAGLGDRDRSGRPRHVDSARVIVATLTPPAKSTGLTHWSSRALAKKLNIGNATVAQIWREHRIQPWRAEGLRLSTDPELGRRSSTWWACTSIRRRTPSCCACDVVFVGLDEATALWDRTTPDVRRFLPEPRILVVKQGAAGATVYDEDAELFVPTLKVDVAEPVGAGDAFAGGFITGLHRRRSPARAARLGVIAAGSALSAVGERPPADTVEELRDLDEVAWRRQAYPRLGLEEGGRRCRRPLSERLRS